jgi:hypothetical protein
MPTLIIKSGTTAIAGATVKGSFSYFSGSTKDLGPTSSTGFYAGIDAPEGGYVVYQIGGPSGWNARVATGTTQLNSILISIGGTGSTADQNITWATNTNSVYINSGATITYTLGQTAFGGYVVAINGSQLTILSLNDPATAAWGCQGTSITGLGTDGLTNTNLILAQCATRPIAASLTGGGTTINGYSDWFLPSESEVTTVINGLIAAGFQSYQFAWYSSIWSSSQGTVNPTINARSYGWGSTTADFSNTDKNSLYYYRAFRIQNT